MGSNDWLDSYCNSTFWDANLTDAPNPQFTRCFQETVLVWGPCFFLLLFSIYHFLILSASKRPRLNWSTIYVIKLVFAVCIFVLMIIQIGYRGYTASNNDIAVPAADYGTPAIIAVTMIFVIAMQIYSHVKGHVSSGVLWLFWFSFTLCQIIPFISFIKEATSDKGIQDVFIFVVFYVFYAFLLGSFLLASFAEPAKRAENDCPETYCSFPSELTFWWFNPILWVGYKKPIEHEDLWRLNVRDTTKHAAPKLMKHWQTELKKSRKAKEKYFASDKYEHNDSVVYANAAFNGNSVKEEPTVTKFTKEKEEEKTPKEEKLPYYQPSLAMAMVKTYGKTMFAAAFFKLCQDTIQFLSPALLSLMIQFTEDTSIYEWYGYVYASAMYLVAVIQAILLNQYFHRCMSVGMNIRTSVISMIYKKALCISNSARQQSTVGEIVNLMSTDAQRFMDLMSYIQILWSGPYVIALALFLLWQQLGPSVMAGFAIMLILIPINGFLTTAMRKLSVQNMKTKDKRIKLMNEILNGIKVLKLYAWEPSFEEQVLELRNEEVKLSLKMANLRAVMIFLWTCAPFFVSLTSFAVFVSVDENNILDSQTAFVSISLFNILRFPLVMLPSVISALVMAQVSFKRINRFLTSDEIDNDAVDRNSKSDNVIEVKDGNFAWERDSDCVLKDISFSVKPGSLIAIVGHVGCGKSSLVSALLGEMEKKCGYVGLRGSVAYVPQQAWIQNATLQDNVMFGKRYKGDDRDEKYHRQQIYVDDKIITEQRYKKIIHSTALGPDLEILPAGDQTEIGEKGINLSGGQKQRVSLARAVCSDADVYLLDDPLSAVDSHIGKHIFDHVIGRDGILNDKTRILVTHSINYLPQVDKIIVLDHGKITEVGTYQELLNRGQDFARFLEEYANKQDEGIEEDEAELLLVTDDDLSSIPESRDVSEDGSTDSAFGDVMKIDDVNSLRRRASMRSSSRSKTSVSKVKGKNIAKIMRQKSELAEKKDELKKKKMKELQEKEGKLTSTETSQEGRVKFGVYVSYMKSIGLWYCVAIIFSSTFYQVSYIGGSVWLSAWSADNDRLPLNESSAKTDMRIGGYGGFGFAQAIFVLANGLIQAKGTRLASKMLHSNILQNIMRVPILFFDTTPFGRIVNRFAKDVYIMDEILPNSVNSWLACVFSCIGTVAVIVYATPIFAAVIVPIGVVYFFAQRFYVATSRQLKRVESVTRSPIYSHFSETVSGVSMIRAFKHDKRFILQSEKKVDINQECYYPNIVSNRWLAVRLEMIGNAIVFFAALFAVLSRGTITGSIAGLSLSYALTITQTLNWWVRMTSEIETNIVSVERLREYAEVENEAPWILEDNHPPTDWPSKGVTEFENYGTRYRQDLDLVLKKIDCKFESGQKVGIVGRTGAGKSSLTLALFRLIEPAEGKIVIDGVDITKIGLHDLRKKLTIIPQDPVLFSGTLRLNLDPFDSYTDEEIWDSLEHAHLKDYVSGLPDKLKHMCAEGGENLSVGQRQLVCLARALLRKSKILILDEATAAVDMQTDDLIQQTIRREFDDCTVITIAHRLNTIVDYDRIVVLSEGRIVEFDSPANLLAQEGVFYGMAKDAGII